MSSTFMRTPVKYFGKKELVAPVVWAAFGKVRTFVDPFCGSLAVLLARPGGANGIELVNDIDELVVNFFRAVKADPDAVLCHCDHPFAETELLACNNHILKVVNETEFCANIRENKDYYDAEIAGLWVFVTTTGLYGLRFAKAKAMMPMLDIQMSALSRRPSLVGGLYTPHESGMSYSKAWLYALRERLQYVKIACGDWRRVVTPTKLGLTDVKFIPTAVFLDPPYSLSMRDRTLYRRDAPGLSDAVRTWAIENGDNRNLRIALCGLEGEHNMPSNWHKIAWKAIKTPTTRKRKENNNNRLERIWFSPWCNAEPDAVLCIGEQEEEHVN